MTWALVIGLAAVVLLAALVVFKVPKGAREAFAAALLLGIAGYALQGHPGEAGAPHAYRETIVTNPEALVEMRRALLGPERPVDNRWLVVADAMVRNGSFADAVTVLRGAVDRNPGDSEAWLAMGNAIVAHADGILTPAALLAYRRAARADPGSPGPAFFLGLGLAQSGQLGEARAMWAQLLAGAPADAPWRAEVAVRLDRLDQFIAAAQNAGANAAPQ